SPAPSVPAQSGAPAAPTAFRPPVIEPEKPAAMKTSATASGQPGVTAVPPEVWNVKADPVPGAIELESEGKAKVNVPDSFFGGEVVFPVVPSPFVALGANHDEKGVREFWDVRTRQKFGSMNGVKVDGEHAALSPDGLHFAAPVPFGNGIL